MTRPPKDTDAAWRTFCKSPRTLDELDAWVRAQSVLVGWNFFDLSTYLFAAVCKPRIRWSDELPNKCSRTN